MGCLDNLVTGATGSGVDAVRRRSGQIPLYGAYLHCDEIERQLTLVPIARTSFAATGRFETFTYDRETVETVMARVEHIAR